MTQTLMLKSTKAAQIHLPECNSAKIRQISAKFLPKFAKIPPKIRQISQISFHKRALTLNTQPTFELLLGYFIFSVISGLLADVGPPKS